jgi:hypothetical protein
MGNKSIGLCLSGGGHRASIFSLGALLYLVDANRHCDIEAISSVSGGSLTSGFFAVQPKPLHLMDRTEFDISAASWARQIAGSPAWWYGAFAIHALLFLLWVVFVCVNWGWFPWLAQPTTLRLGGLFRSVTSLHSLCAPDSSDTGPGTLWGWWGTWIYVGIIGPALFIMAFLWWSPCHGYGAYHYSR